MKALVTLDGSATSESILATAHRLAEAMPGIELHLLQVLDPDAAHATIGEEVGQPVRVPGGALPSPVQPRRVIESHGEAQERLHRETAAKLESLARERLAGTLISTSIEWSHRPAEAIVRAADELDVDMVVMATHGRSGLSRAILGSVAEEVIRESRRPVLVQRPGA